MNEYLILYGEYPFNNVIGMRRSASAEAALAEWVQAHKGNFDGAIRHPAVIPFEGELQ